MHRPLNHRGKLGGVGGGEAVGGVGEVVVRSRRGSRCPKRDCKGSLPPTIAHATELASVVLRLLHYLGSMAPRIPHAAEFALNKLAGGGDGAVGGVAR